MREMSIEELSVVAPHVVRGTVLGQVARWTEDRKGILTYIDVAVEERLKGKPALPDVIQIVQPGGELDGVRMRIVGGPVFRDGEQVFLFLDRYSDADDEAGMTVLVGGAMGRMPVVPDPAGGPEPVVLRQFDDLDFARFVEEKGSRRMEISPAPPSRVVPIQEFRKSVREAAASGRRPGPREAARDVEP